MHNYIKIENGNWKADNVTNLDKHMVTIMVKEFDLLEMDAR